MLNVEFAKCQIQIMRRMQNRCIMLLKSLQNALNARFDQKIKISHNVECTKCHIQKMRRMQKFNVECMKCQIQTMR